MIISNLKNFKKKYTIIIIASTKSILFLFLVKT